MRRCLGCMREYDEMYDVCPECGYVAGSPAESIMHLAPGTTLQNGRYILGKVLGQGGFGITYIAWDEKLDRPVAVKEYMPRAYASRVQGDLGVTCYNEEARRQFQAGLDKVRKETRTLARYNDLESVVRVYDCIEENGTAYIIMELLRGRTVKQTLGQSGTFSFNATVQIILPILLTLQQIHKTGMIHRDISPDNIFLCENGTVKLLDFGSARVISGVDQKELSVILKPGYAPKEQYSTRGAQGSWTDLYSVAATMYKMLTGETPVDSLSRSEEDDPLLPIGEAADVPEDAAQAIMNAMAIEPKNRTQTADALLNVLSRYSNNASPSGVSDGHGGGFHAGKLVKIAAAVVLAAAAVAAGIIFLPKLFPRKDVPVPVDTEWTFETPDVAPTADTAAWIKTREAFEKDETDAALFTAAVDPENAETAYTYTLSEGAQTLLVRYNAQGETIGSELTERDGERLLRRIEFDGSGAVLTAEINEYDGDRQTLCAQYAGAALEICDVFIYENDTLTQTQSFDSTLTCVQVETYEHKGTQTTRSMQQDTDGGLLGYVDFTYDKNGSVSEEREFAAKGTLLRTKSFTANGAVDSERFYDKGGNVTREQEYVYEGDRLIKYTQYKDRVPEQITQYTYDGGSLTQAVRTRRDGSQESALRYEYGEEDGTLVCVRSFNADNNVVREQHTDGSHTFYEYNSDGALKYSESRDAANEKIGYETVEVNAAGKPERKDTFVIEDGEEKSTGHTEYGYDGAMHSESVYDEKDRLVEIIYYSDGNEIYSRTTYDGNEERPLVSTDYENGEVVRKTVTEYDGSGNMTSEKVYDGEDDLISRVEKTYHENNQTKRMTWYEKGDVLETEYEYRADGTIIRELHAQRNDSGDVTGYLETGYDAQERITKEVTYDAKMNETKREEYTYDLFGNRRKRLL